MEYHPPIGLLYIASYIMEKSDYKIEILDSVVINMSYMPIGARDKKKGSNLINISALTPNIVSALTLAGIAKV